MTPSVRARWRLSLLLGLILAAAVVPVTAAAQPAGGKTEAKRKASAGARLLEEHRPREGLALLEEAYALDGDARYQYDIALAHRALGDDAEALAAFDRFIAGAKATGLPEHIADAVEQQKALRLKIAELQLACSEEGAQISVDGKVRGTWPQLTGLYLPPGAHELTATKNNFRAFRQSLDLAAGAKRTLFITLVSEAATPLAAPLPPDERARESAPDDRAAPFYRRWWFWSAVGGAVAAGVITAVVLSSGSDACKGMPCLDWSRR